MCGESRQRDGKEIQREREREREREIKEDRVSSNIVVDITTQNIIEKVFHKYELESHLIA